MHLPCAHAWLVAGIRRSWPCGGSAWYSSLRRRTVAQAGFLTGSLCNGSRSRSNPALCSRLLFLPPVSAPCSRYPSSFLLAGCYPLLYLLFFLALSALSRDTLIPGCRHFSFAPSPCRPSRCCARALASTTCSRGAVPHMFPPFIFADGHLRAQLPRATSQPPRPPAGSGNVQSQQPCSAPGRGRGSGPSTGCGGVLAGI